MLILLHSVTDIITNSSTIIYTRAKSNAIGVLTELVNALMEATGSDLRAEDMFKFSLETVREDQVWNDYRLYYYDSLPDDHDGNEWVAKTPFEELKKADVKPPWWNDEERLGLWDCHSNIYVKVATKDERCAHAARVIERLHEVFETPDVSTEG